MALTRQNEFDAGTTLTESGIEGEFDYIYNNALTLISPLTGNLACGGNSITGIAALTLSANDGGALGASGTAFSDLFLASGGVINWNAGNVTLTHAAGSLTIAAGGVTLGRLVNGAGWSTDISGIGLRLDEGGGTNSILSLRAKTTSTIRFDGEQIEIVFGANNNVNMALVPIASGMTTGASFELRNAADTDGLRFEYLSNATPLITVTGSLVADRNLTVRPKNATSIPWVIQGAASQSANLQNWIDSAGTVLGSVSSGGVLSLSGGAANAQAWNVKTLTELTTIAAAATTDTVIQIPVNAVVFAVSVRVTVAIPTAATFTVIGTTTSTAFNTAAVSTALNSTDVGTLNTPYRNGAAQTIRITPNLTPADTTGRVRVTVHYYDITVPTG
mgnify:CR=1 FL=1